jgi:hypothetical protein
MYSRKKVACYKDDTLIVYKEGLDNGFWGAEKGNDYSFKFKFE